MTKLPQIAAVGIILTTLMIASPARAIGVSAGVRYIDQSKDGLWNLDPGFGLAIQGGLGGDIFGVLGEFSYASMDHKPGPLTTGGETAHIYGGLLSLKVRPLGAMDFPVQPYGIVGVGVQYMNSGVAAIPDETGPQGALGAGLDVDFNKHFSIGIEGDWKPFFYWAEAPGAVDTDFRTMNFFMASLTATVRF